MLFRSKGQFDFDGARHELVCQVRKGHKKVFREDGIDYEKLSDHIGKYPVVIISPTDVDLVKEGSEARRKFFDSIVSQIDSHYLESLLSYQQTLRQRNGLLKMFNERGYQDLDLIDSYDQQLAQTGIVVHRKRKDFIDEFLPVFNSMYNFLVDEKERARLHYKTEIVDEGQFVSALKENLRKDMVLQRSTFGIHRDDYEFEFEFGELRKLGSQGQQKSFLVAIKLAHYDVIKRHKGFNPILLLDDIFDKLDDHRIEKLLKRVTSDDFGQLFITDAGPERTLELMTKLGIDFETFNVDNGIISH